MFVNISIEKSTNKQNNNSEKEFSKLPWFWDMSEFLSTFGSLSETAVTYASVYE